MAIFNEPFELGNCSLVWEQNADVRTTYCVIVLISRLTYMAVMGNSKISDNFSSSSDYAV